MKPNDFDRDYGQALADLAARPLPSLPPAFRDDVARAVRLRRATPAPRFRIALEEAVAAFLRPRAVAGALAFSLVVGAVAGTALAGGERSLHDVAAVRGSALAAFGPHAPGMPATLLEALR